MTAPGSSASPSPLARIAPTETLSKTVMFGKVRRFWKVRPTPSRATSNGRIPVIKRPSKRTSPSDGGVTPEIMLNKVVLPAPFGPISPTNSPRRTSAETWSTAVSPPKRRVRPCKASSGALTKHPDASRAGDGFDA